MNHSVRNKLTLLVGLVAAVLVACSSDNAASTDDSSVVPDSGIDLASTAQAIAADSSAMTRVAQPLIVECMAQLGFVYVPGDVNNGKSLSAVDQARYSAALQGSKRIEWSGLFGQRGSDPADGCVADARARVAGDLQAYVDIQSARRDVESLQVYVLELVNDGMSRAEAMSSETVQSNLPAIVDRWQVARAKGAAQLSR
jgi:hypothetical protein